ncbi:peptidylprolyl isomerase [Actinospica durhamensis]|uniref:peptidylprolyl isomerase n=1 Tax=Actinospica durhamensis TaxID=1508375 RepID=UPI0027DCC26B|nr:peptidylprolyl isomerase [Actinospica durhamensis]
MATGDQPNGGNSGWVSPGQEPQDAVPQDYVPQQGGVPQGNVPPQPPSYPQQPYPQYPQYPQQQPYPQQPPYPQPGGQYPQPPHQYPQPGNPQFYPQQQPYPQQPAPWPTVPQRPGAFRSRSSAATAVIVISVALAVIVAGIAIALLGGAAPSPAVAGGVQTSSAPQSAAPQPSAEASSPAGDTPQSCSTAAGISSEPIGYHVCGTAARSVGVPAYAAAPAHKTYTVTIKTNRGNIVFTANGNAAPYTVYSFVYLIEKRYFDNTDCTRLVTVGIYVLQCGDPTGTGAGGPGYAFQDENLASLGTPDSEGAVTYKAGVVAMANAGPDTNGSQFFLVYKDSSIDPAYTPFGTITEGLNIIQQVAQAGSNDVNGSGDGVPNDQVHIESVTESVE